MVVEISDRIRESLTMLNRRRSDASQTKQLLASLVKQYAFATMIQAWLPTLVVLVGGLLDQMATAADPSPSSAATPAPADLPAANPDGEWTPIDLASALRLAGVRNLELVRAQQRVEAAVAGQQFAAAQILPNLNLGTNYDSHTGVLQQPSGVILSVDRSALYIGAARWPSVPAPCRFPDCNTTSTSHKGSSTT